jgi:hypothetical protein
MCSKPSPPAGASSPGATFVTGRRVAREAADGDGGRAERDSRQPVGGGLDDDQVGAGDHRATGLAQPGGERGHLRSGGVEAADGVVVRVAHRDRPVGQHRHAQRMLEERLCCGTVAPPEVEQPGADEGTDLPVHDPAQRRCLRVGQPEPGRRSREARGLGEPRRAQRTVAQPLVGGAGSHLDPVAARIEGPELVDSRHGHPDTVLPPRDVPGRGQGVDAVTLHPLPPGADQRAHGSVGQPHTAQCVVDGVGDDHVVSGRCGRATNSVAASMPPSTVNAAGTLRQGSGGIPQVRSARS